MNLCEISLLAILQHQRILIRTQRREFLHLNFHQAQQRADYRLFYSSSITYITLSINKLKIRFDILFVSGMSHYNSNLFQEVS